MEKIGTMMQRPNEDATQRDDVAWWMKYAGRGLGTVGGGSKMCSKYIFNKLVEECRRAGLIPHSLTKSSATVDDHFPTPRE